MRIVTVILMGILIINMVVLKNAKEEKKCRLCAISICVIAFLMNTIVYSQDTVLEYKSPEEVYMEVQNGRPYNVIEGKETAYVIGSKDSIIVERTNNGWRYPVKSMIRAKAIKKEEDFTIYVEQYNQSEEYYVTVLYLGEDSVHITDNRNSCFQNINQEDSHFYCTYVNQIDDEYTIILNDKVIEVFE